MNIIYYPYCIKENDIKELENGILTLGDFYTYTQPSDFKPYLYDYNGTRYGPIQQDEKTDTFDGITIYDLKDKTVKTAIMRYHNGNFSINIDISTCPTNRSLLYFVFRKWFDFKKMMIFQRLRKDITPQKRQRV